MPRASHRLPSRSQVPYYQTRLELNSRLSCSHFKLASEPYSLSQVFPQRRVAGCRSIYYLSGRLYSLSGIARSIYGGTGIDENGRFWWVIPVRSGVSGKDRSRFLSEFCGLRKGRRATFLSFSEKGSLLRWSTIFLFLQNPQLRSGLSSQARNRRLEKPVKASTVRISSFNGALDKGKGRSDTAVHQESQSKPWLLLLILFAPLICGC